MLPSLDLTMLKLSFVTPVECDLEPQGKQITCEIQSQRECVYLAEFDVAKIPLKINIYSLPIC